VGHHVLALVGAVSVSAFIISAFLAVHSDRLYSGFERLGLLRQLLRHHPDALSTPKKPKHPRGHIIVVGMNDLGRKLALELHERGESVLAIDSNPARLTALPCPTMAADIEYEASLEEAGLAHAKLAVSALRMASTNALFAVRSQSLGVPVALHVFDHSVAESLKDLESCYLVQPKLEAGQQIMSLLDGLGLSRPLEPA
jgi:voltage-gated potassium channel